MAILLKLRERINIAWGKSKKFAGKTKGFVRNPRSTARDFQLALLKMAITRKSKKVEGLIASAGTIKHKERKITESEHSVEKAKFLERRKKLLKNWRNTRKNAKIVNFLIGLDKKYGCVLISNEIEEILSAVGRSAAQVLFIEKAFPKIADSNARNKALADFLRISS